MTLNEITARLEEISKICETAENDELVKLENETNELIAQRNKIMDNAQHRDALLNSIAQGARGAALPTAAQPLPTAAKMFDRTSIADAAEYRTGWLKSIRNSMGASGSPIALTPAERAAIDTGDVTNIIPTQINNRILELVKSYAPLLNSITLLHANGSVKYAIENSRTRAGKHAENTAITDSDIDLRYVTLSAFELVKRVTISESVKTMTIDGFESWLTTSLAHAMAEEINYLILYGAGTDEATGIDTITWTEGTNMLTVGATATLTSKNVYEFCAMLPAKYDRGASWVMSKRTLFTEFLPLQDNSKNSLVVNQNGRYYIQGYPVALSDDVPVNDAYLGDWSKIAGNIPQNATIKSAFDIDTNSYKYLIASMFDCKPAFDDAFVKLTKAST